MEVYASGFAEHHEGYFISCESASGVMTDWRTLMGIPNIRVFSPNVKGFSLNSVHGSRNKDFLWVPRQETRVCAYSAEVKVPECVQSSESSHVQIKGNYHKTNTEDKISYLLPKFQHP
jgi:hypothetical protein